MEFVGPFRDPLPPDIPSMFGGLARTTPCGTTTTPITSTGFTSTDSTANSIITTTFTTTITTAIINTTTNTTDTTMTSDNAYVPATGTASAYGYCY